MPAAPQNHVIPQWVDPRKFAQQAVFLEGNLDAQRLKRVAEAGIEIQIPLQARLQFSVDQNYLRILEGTLFGEVNISCQRCLDWMTVPVKATFKVGVVLDDEQAKRLPKTMDPWLIDSESADVDLYALLEDEILLALPMVAYHQEQCVDPSLFNAGDAEQGTGNESQKPNPFQLLEQLKQGPGKK